MYNSNSKRQTVEDRLRCSLPNIAELFENRTASITYDDVVDLSKNQLFRNIIVEIHREIIESCLATVEPDEAVFRNGYISGMRRVLEIMNKEEESGLAASSEQEE